MQSHSHHVTQHRNAALDLAPVLMPAAIMEIAMDGVIVCYERMPHAERRQFWQLQTLPDKLALLARYASRPQPAAAVV